MDSQWNDLNTDNLALSDELSAPGVYEVGKETAYARSKAIKTVTLSVSTLLIAAGGVLEIQSFNPFITGLPEISESSYVYEDGVLTYGFAIANKGNYSILFYVQAEKANEPLYSSDISAPKHYEGIVKDLKIGVSYKGHCKISNGFDYESDQCLFSIDEKGALL